MLAIGETVTLVPVPTYVPPQLPLYHFQTAPAPKLPPDKDNVVEAPLQMVEDVAEIDTAGNDVSLTFMVVVTQAVVLHVPSARTKYAVFEVGETVILEPLPNNVPPQVPLYHFQVAPVPSVPPCTLRTDDFPLHIRFADAFIALAGIEVSRTVIEIDTHDVILQSPSALTK